MMISLFASESPTKAKIEECRKVGKSVNAEVSAQLIYAQRKIIFKGYC